MKGSRWPKRLKFMAVLFLVVAVYFLLEHLRLPRPVVKWIQWGFSWAGAVYLILGIWGAREGVLFRFTRSFSAAIGALFLLVSFGGLSYFLVQPILIPEEEIPAAKAAVVLGGGVDRDGTPTESTIRRVVRGARLYHAGKVPLLLFSSGMPAPSRQSEAAAMAQFAEALGVPRVAMVLESRSRNTAESARFVAAMLKERRIRRILLVTDPVHMRRARDTFQSQGIAVIPAPTNKARKIYGYIGHWTFFQRGLHEYLGWFYYRIRGFIQAPGQKNAGA